MPSFKKINSEQNHKEETSQNNTAINKAGQKTIGRIKTGQNKAGRGISGKAVRKSGKAVLQKKKASTALHFSFRYSPPL